MTTWHTTAEVASRVHRSTDTVLTAAASRELHGHQPLRDGRPVRGGKWSFAAAAVDAWMQGLDERAQREVCGCAGLRLARSKAS